MNNMGNLFFLPDLDPDVFRHVNAADRGNLGLLLEMLQDDEQELMLHEIYLAETYTSMTRLQRQQHYTQRLHVKIEKLLSYQGCLERQIQILKVRLVNLRWQIRQCVRYRVRPQPAAGG